MPKKGTSISASIEEPKIPFYNDPQKRSWFFQFVVISLVALVGYYLVSNTISNLERQSIASGFGFLNKEAGFEIGESIFPYTASDQYSKALLVGVFNTLLVALVGNLLTILLGTLIGIARLSKNWLLSKLAAVYIEVFQNIPILLQLFFWYAFFTEMLPSPRQAISAGAGIFLCNRGLYLPLPASHPAFKHMFLTFIVVLIAVYIFRRYAKKRQDKTGQQLPLISISLAALIIFPALTWLISGAPTQMSIPKLSGFNFEGGLNISPEFAALLLGLVLYTAAFVAEVVRAGIQAVSKGQTEAAKSIGLKTGQVMRLVILPQALRVIVPPLTSQMLNLTKNSSLAVAIGYPDFVYVANTTINQTGQALEGVALIMACYLCFSLGTSVFMNWYNKKVKLVER